VPLFAGLPGPQIEALARDARVRRFRPGEALFHEDDPGHTLYAAPSAT